MGAIQHFTQFLLGRDPMNAGALWQEMCRIQYFEGGRVLTSSAPGFPETRQMAY
jgi:galactonate dehydratase